MNTLELWRATMRAQGLSERTIAERSATIRHLLAYSGVTPQGLAREHIVSYLGRRLSKSTKATYHASIRAFCAWMMSEDLRDDDPTAKTLRPKRPKLGPRPIEAAQFDAVLAAANRRRTRMYVLLAALAGLRVHEIAKIRGEDLDWSTLVLEVVGKGETTGYVPLHERLAPEVELMPRTGYWFPSYDDEREHVSSHAVSAAISGAMARAGVRGTPHQLRHFCATELVAADVNLRVVQAIMRHRSPATTALYADVTIVQLRDGVSRLLDGRGDLAA